jgi:hypothetical protein
MPDDPGDDLEPQVSALEGGMAEMQDRVSKARTDSAAARILASGADHDVSEVRVEMRAVRHALNALRATQVDHGKKINRLDDRVSTLETTVTAGFAGMDAGFAEMRAGFGTMRAGMAEIVGLLDGNGRDK